MPKRATKSLGQVEFADWYEAPVFEPDSDERLEEMATSSRGPLRLAASAFLRVDARAARLRRRPPTLIPLAAGPGPDDVHRAAARPPARSQSAVALAERPAAPVAPRTKRTKATTDPKKAPLDEVAWRTWSTWAEDNGLDHALAELDQDRRPAGRSIHSLRRRLGQALDHWAERETEVGLRLDRALFRRTREP